jgi:hypothetical protein
MQVLESSNHQDHADANVERPGIDTSEEAIGDGNGICLLNMWCSTSRGSLQGCIPGDWSCQRP